ncbi:MAG: histidine phosphatase family protein [Anaerolineales bacterium]|nr:histidine phosphatase family protein [Anaerolineales bacterium]
MATRFILIRHGQTEWNRGAERFRGRADVPLNDLGHAQAQRVASRLANEKLAAIYSSPQQRTRHTAQPLADALKLPVQPHDGLLDIDVGALEGMTIDEARQVFPDVMLQWQNAPGVAKFPKGESFKQMRARIVALLGELAPKHDGATIALVTHRVVCCAMLCVVLGLEPNALWRIRQDNACVNSFEKQEQGFVVTLLNDTRHLEEGK